MEHRAVAITLLLKIFTSFATAFESCPSETSTLTFCWEGYHCCNGNADYDGLCCQDGYFCSGTSCISYAVIWVPIMIVIGIIAGVVVLIICCKKKQGSGGTIVQPQGAMVVQTTGVPMQPYGQQPVLYGQQPVPYGQQPVPYGQQPVPYGQPAPYSG